MKLYHKNGSVIFDAPSASTKEVVLAALAADANLWGVVLQGAYLAGADLQGAYLLGADLRGADLRGAYLSDADLEGADLEGADLQSANLRGANLRNANLAGADLRCADLRNATLPDGREFEDYLKDHLAGLCDTPEIREKALAAWGKHSWADCPMHSAFGWGSADDAPEDKRIAVAAWVALYDGAHLGKP